MPPPPPTIAALKAAYRSGDVYHALARLCGLTNDPDPVRWKKQNPDVRNRMKPLQLGINYGMGVPALARGLDRHPLIASGIIELHRRTYPRFWQYRDDRVMIAMLDRRIESSQRLAARRIGHQLRGFCWRPTWSGSSTPAKSCCRPGVTSAMASRSGSTPISC